MVSVRNKKNYPSIIIGYSVLSRALVIVNHGKGLRALRPKNSLKLTHIVMTNSCVDPLIETDMKKGYGHYIWGQNGPECYDH